MSSAIRVRIKVTGLVQGVYYRAHTVEKAKELSVFGWVANEGDGSVIVVAEGEENQIQNLIDWCWSGPSKAEVKNVQTEKESFTGEFQDFEIRY